LSNCHLVYECNHENMEYSRKDNCIGYYSAKWEMFQHQLYRENILGKKRY